MRILLVHPEDSPSVGAWSRQHWDLLVDLGQSTEFSHRNWNRIYGCPILSAASFGHGVEDAREAKRILSDGEGYLFDEEGIDHWELISVGFAQEIATGLALQRLVAELPKAAEFWCTRGGWLVIVLRNLLNQPIKTFDQSQFARASAEATHYAEVFRRFHLSQLKEIFLDKYDSGYRWRARFAQKRKNCSEPVVLIPSAYQNVSRVASAYAEMLPSQSFLVVATRRSAHQFAAPKNVQTRDLAEYAGAPVATTEVGLLMERWIHLQKVMDASGILRTLLQLSSLDSSGNWLRNGIHARNAWKEVLRREPVCGVLCGDDSNRYTRLPVLLAAKRNIATVDFHHGALDGHYVLKNVPSDTYLTKSEMEHDYALRVCGLPAEKVFLAPPASRGSGMSSVRRDDGRSIILFSEPYEAAGLRAAEVYGELLPNLWDLARENGRSLIIKLHPFESRSHRSRLLYRALPAEAARQVRLIDGPLTDELMAQAWCGLTIESTTAIECFRRGVCCFLCGWFTMSMYDYVHQYVRFGIGEILESADQIRGIPQRVEAFRNRLTATSMAVTADPALLQQWLTSGRAEPCSVRSAS